MDGVRGGGEGGFGGMECDGVLMLMENVDYLVSEQLLALYLQATEDRKGWKSVVFLISQNSDQKLTRAVFGVKEINCANSTDTLTFL